MSSHTSFSLRRDSKLDDLMMWDPAKRKRGRHSSEAKHPPNASHPTSLLGSNGGAEKGRRDLAGSTVPPTVMAHHVLEYVMLQELGGRGNAVKATEGGSPESCLLSPGVLQAERSTLRPGAREALHYTVKVVGGAALQCLQPPVLLRQRLPDEALRHLQSLQVCHYERDLTGGVTRAASTPAVRAHLLNVLEAGLAGKRYCQETAIGSSSGTEKREKETTEAVTSSLSLFDWEENRRATNSDEAGMDGDENAFSLDKYLEDTTGSSDSGND